MNKERLNKTFVELVSLPCESLHEKPVAEYIKTKLQSLGLDYVQDDVQEQTGGDCGNIIVTLPATVQDDRPGIFFEAHMDSVPPVTGTKVVRKDGVFYSDGTTVLGGDDKVGVAAMLEALTTIKEKNLPHGKVQFLFTVSEEIGCCGAKFIDAKYLQSRFGYCLDGEGKLGEVTYAAPQQYKITVKVIGKTAHAGLEPEKGINAIMLAGKAITALPKYGRLDEETTLNVGLMQGGVAPNIVAPSCEFVIDMRSLNVPKLEKLKNQTLAIIEKEVKSTGGQVECQVDLSCPACVVDKKDLVVTLAAQAAKNLGAKEINLQKSGGCSDGNFFCGKGYPAVVLGTGMSNVHTTSEYLREEDLWNTARWVEEIVRLTGAAK